MVPESHARALAQSAEDNGRSVASEVRLAIQFWLKAHGRLAG